MNASSTLSLGATLLVLLFSAAGRPLAAQEADSQVDPPPTVAEEDSDPAARSAATESDGDDSAGRDSGAPRPGAAAITPAESSAPGALPTDTEPVRPRAPASTQVEAGESGSAEDDELLHRPVLLPAPRKAKVEAASFKGIQPGRSTTADLEESWGAPREIRKADGQRLQTYRIESFPKVTVSLVSGQVSSIVVNLAVPLGTEEVAKELGINDISSVQVTDDKGQLLGEAFPERGVLFGYSPKGKTQRVSQIVLEPIDPAPFLLRAESHLRAHYARCLADANAALQIDPQSAPAHGLRARVYRRAGDYALAVKAVEAALELEPDEPDWKLLLAKILIETSDFPRAKQLIAEVLDAPGCSSLSKCKAHLLMADCLALGAERDERAMKQYLESIKLAEPLANSAHLAVRRGAEEVLLDAHLGIAQDIAWGRWQQKSQAIAKWTQRAAAVAKDLVQQEQGEEDFLLRVDLETLNALSGMSEPRDPSETIESCRRHMAKLIGESPDRARTAQLEWQFGLALSDAAEIEHARGRHEEALKLGQSAFEHLVAGDAAGHQLPNHDFLLGRLFYRLGVTAAVGKQDHKQALEWYQKAVALLESPVPPSRAADPGRQGETFVSIAVSYWDRGHREEALRLTRQGIKLMENAAEEGLLSRSALAVPYGNLASMHAELGNKKLATEFAALAAKCEREKR